MVLRKLLLVLIAFICLFEVSEAQITTEGTDFWFGFSENIDPQLPSSLEIFITSNEVTSGTIQVFTDGRTIDFEVTPGVTFKEVISESTFNAFAARGSGVIQQRAIHITSDANISVYAFNNRMNSADAAVILPTNSLGQRYYAATYFEQAPADDAFSSGNSPSEILIVASANDTQIEITPTEATTDGKLANTPFTITLNQGDLYQLTSFADLTGTLIESSDDGDDCKSFAVFGGNRWTRVTGGQDCLASRNIGGGNVQRLSGGFAGDHLYEQMYPVNTWGRRYAAIPFEGRTGYVLQVTASEDNTVVRVGGQPTVTLNEGEFRRYNMADAALVTADKPIQVAQLSQSLSCDFDPGSIDPNGPGDPFMLMLSPNEQFLNRITFNALEALAINEYFVSIIVRSDDTDQITLNGNPIDAIFSFAPGDPEFSFATVSIDKGEDYTLDSESGFIAYIYGFGQIESFGYVAGASLENLNLQVVGEDETIGVLVEEGCLNSLVDFSVQFDLEPGEEPVFDTFQWDFGDGRTAEGASVTHVFDEAGTFEITLVASDGLGACSNSEIVTRTFLVPDTMAGDIEGPSSVCPDVTDITYSIEGPDDNTYEWLIAGGTITSPTTTSDNVVVDWHGANEEAYIKVIPFNLQGCRGDTLTLPILINRRLEPVIPTGPPEVCFTDFESVAYSTSPTNGSVYQWFIDGGRILRGGDTPDVTVQWDGPGTGSLWYMESNPLITDCEGTSDPLEVIIYEEIIATEVISDVLCNGEDTGALSVDIIGGKPGGFTVTWDNGMTGPNITGLVRGTYVGTITDPLGCEIEVTYEVGEPPVLEITDSNIIDVRCFEELNGMINLVIAGGTPDAGGLYSYRWTGPNTNTVTTEPMISGLATGDYSVVVTDSNGCETTMDFFVDQPLLLEPDLETLINQPICPDANDGTAFIEAKEGTPDYQFFWSNNPTADQQEGQNFSRGTYTVRIVDANGCETSLDVDIVERFPRIFVPNAFSPNGDGINDEFKPVTDCQLVYSMQIFNQWGSITYATSDISDGWDGTLDGQNVPDGKYSYVIFYAGSLNGVAFEETLRGTLRLYR